MGHLGYWSLSCHRRGRKGRNEEGRKGKIEIGHWGFWRLGSHRRRGGRKGRREEGRGRLRWDIWDTGA